jgi:hypothetical protein
MLVMLANDPRKEDNPSHNDYYEGSQEINKDPVIGGADDVYRENPSDDLRDSDIVDADPLQEDVDRDRLRNNKLAPPFDSDEGDDKVSNLEDAQDLTDDETRG